MADRIQQNFLRVMLIDDRPERREILNLALRDVDCALVACLSGDADLLSAVDSCDPDLILIGVEAPGRVGTVVVQFRARQQQRLGLLAGTPGNAGEGYGKNRCACFNFDINTLLQGSAKPVSIRRIRCRRSPTVAAVYPRSKR